MLTDFALSQSIGKLPGRDQSAIDGNKKTAISDGLKSFDRPIIDPSIDHALWREKGQAHPRSSHASKGAIAEYGRKDRLPSPGESAEFSGAGK